MEIKETHIEMKEVEVVDKHYDQCDKCDKEIKGGGWDAFDFEFNIKTGTWYPECSFGTDYKLDLCAECSEEMIALLQENNYKVRESEFSN